MQDKKIEAPIKDGWIDESKETTDDSNDHIPIDIYNKCFGEKQEAIKIIDLEARKGYNCVIHTTARNSYEKYIGDGWYEFYKEKKLKAGDELSFSMRPHADFMYVFVIRS
ncbi:unnamed protein product [Vicia faba]|uniref:TF-B3 domain-containing protein n=1 Tax=Vicia faba TaxID=3906 RepID=A0AAV0ZY61_VICFA|nr:unnamed protein product [Vicia faba]